MFQPNVVEEIKRQIYVQYLLPPHPNRAIYVEQCGGAGQATDDNMVHEHCMMDN